MRPQWVREIYFPNEEAPMVKNTTIDWTLISIVIILFVAATYIQYNWHMARKLATQIQDAEQSK
jgi:flagellar basal body-associated protein FliL